MGNGKHRSTVSVATGGKIGDKSHLLALWGVQVPVSAVYRYGLNYALDVRLSHDVINPSRKPAVEEWFDQYHQRLLGFLTHELNVEAEADDLAQEVFLRLLRLDDTDAVNHPRAFLFRIAANVVADWRNRHRRMSVETPETFERMPSSASPVNALVADARAKALDDALTRLPPSQSSALVLRVKHGLSYREVASHLGVSERMVKRYVVKGYASMREYLADL